jgi:quinol monooxygenase YgiN
MYARMGTFDVQKSNMDEAAAAFRDQVVLAFAKHSGFLGYQAYLDRENGRLVGVSLWATRSHLEASAETGSLAVAIAAKIGAIVVGEMQILELAFDVHS